MINCKELSIGNVVWLIFEERILELTIGAEIDKCADNPDYFEYLPITEDRLLNNMGFKKWGRDDMPRTISYEAIAHPEFRIFPANSFCDFTGYGFMHYKTNQISESARFKLKYVHQLQNLFRLFTNKELPYLLNLTL